jgi:hypothetical protein
VPRTVRDSKCHFGVLLAEARRLWAHSATADLVPLAHAGLVDWDSAWERMVDTVLLARLADPARGRFLRRTYGAPPDSLGTTSRAACLFGRKLIRENILVTAENEVADVHRSLILVIADMQYVQHGSPR